MKISWIKECSYEEEHPFEGLFFAGEKALDLAIREMETIYRNKRYESWHRCHLRYDSSGKPWIDCPGGRYLEIESAEAVTDEG
jgi:hypothetical protein